MRYRKKATENDKAQGPEERIASLEIAPAKQVVADAVALIKKSKRPVIIMGHCSRFQRKEVVAFAEELKASVVTTFKGKGLVSDHNPLGGEVLGRTGTPIASWFMNECDLLLVFGTSFSNHIGITPK